MIARQSFVYHYVKRGAGEVLGSILGQPISLGMRTMEDAEESACRPVGSWRDGGLAATGSAGLPQIFLEGDAASRLRLRLGELTTALWEEWYSAPPSMVDQADFDFSDLLDVLYEAFPGDFRVMHSLALGIKPRTASLATVLAALLT